MKQYTTFQEIGLLALRLVLAMIFLSAGYAKFFFWSTPPTDQSAAMVSLMQFLFIAELSGGAAVLVGFLTRLAAGGLAVIMAGSLYFVHIVMGAPLFTSPQATGLDYNLTLLAACLTLAAFGAGSWSVDAVQRRQTS